MTKEHICPIMSDSQGFVMCQGEKCHSAYPWRINGELFWICEIIEGKLGGGE